MIQLMLVAGRGSAGLKEFMMSSSSTITVSYCYENLVSYRNVIDREYITVDKFLYIYQDKDMDLRKDMSYLKGVLTRMKKGEGFFTCDEIIFFCNTTLDQSAVSIFEKTMSMSGFTNYKIKTSNDNFAYNDIYKYMLNISTDSLAVVKHKNIVRVKRGSTVKQVFEPEKDKSTEALVNYDFDNMKQYDKAKDSARRSDTGKLYHDREFNDVITEKYDNPILKTVDAVNPFSQNRRVHIITGNPKSGVSTNTALLACSAVEAGKNVTIINLTKDASTISYVRTLRYGYLSLALKNFMNRKDLNRTQPICFVNIPNGMYDIRLQGLRYVLEHNEKLKDDVIFIEVPKDILQDVLNLVGIEINRVFYSIENMEREFENNFNMLSNMSESFKVVLIIAELLNIMKSLNQDAFNKRLDTSEIRSMFDQDIKIVEPLHISKIDESLYNVLTRV